MIFQETVVIAHRTSRLVCHFGALCAIRCNLSVTVLDQSQPGVRRRQREREGRGEGGGRRGNNGGARKTSGHETDLARAVTEIFKLDSEIN